MNKIKELVTVVVPVYNVKKYLYNCIESILRQTYKNFEIILVDDGSTDGSETLCDKFSSENSNVFVIHKSNGGLSEARNYGIELARGKYICFIDSDDVVTPDYIESMMRYVNGDVKISACGYCRYYDSEKSIKINYENIARFYNGIEAQKYLNILGYFNVSACNKIFDISLFKEIRFPVGRKSEDWYVMYKLIERAGGIYYNSDVKYFYRQRNGSITKSKSINTECIGAAKEVYKYYIDRGWTEAIPYAAQSLAFAYIGVYNAYLCGTNDRKIMKEIRNKVLKLKRYLTLNDLTKSRKIQLLLFLNCKVVYNIAFKIFDLKRKNN